VVELTLAGRVTAILQLSHDAKWRLVRPSAAGGCLIVGDDDIDAEAAALRTWKNIAAMETDIPGVSAVSCLLSLEARCGTSLRKSSTSCSPISASHRQRPRARYVAPAART
jgi:hypothetical protein